MCQLYEEDIRMENPFVKQSNALQEAVMPQPNQKLDVKIGRQDGFIVIELNPVRGVYLIPKRDARALANRLINEAMK